MPGVNSLKSDIHVKVHYMKFRYGFLFLLVAVVVAACQPPPVLRDDGFLQDTSLLTGDPCEAPCWQGIIPGETSWRDAITMIEDNPEYTDFETVQDDQSEAELINFNDGDGPQCCRIITDDGETVSAILTLLAPQMQLGDVIDKFGEPAYVTGGDVSPDQTLLSVLFPDVPLVVYVFGAGTENGELTPASEIIDAIYMDDAGMEELVTATNLYNWEGYVALSTLLDENFDVTPLPSAEAEPGDEEAEPETETE